MELYGRYFSRYKVPFLIAVLCVSLEALCDLLGPTLMSRIVNEGIEKGALAAVYHWGRLMLAVTLTGACFAVIRNNLASYVSQKMGTDLRADLFKKIMSFSEDSTDKIDSGSLITRMTNDTTQIVQFVNGLMRIFLKAPITCIGSIVLASWLNLRLSIVIYSVVAVVALLIYFSMKLSYQRFYLLQKAMDRVNSKVQEYLIGIRLVKAFGTYGKETEKFAEVNDDLMRKSMASQMVITVTSPFLTFVVGGGTAAVLYGGSRMFMAGQANVGDITAFTIYMAQILTSLIMITNVFNMFVRTKASTERIGEIFDCEQDFPASGRRRKLEGNITFDGVTFAYPNGSGVPAVKDLSFSVRSGESLAIIGPTGSGKSTLVWLLLRFYDVNAGHILLDGYDIKEMGADEIRNNIALAPQQPRLFSDSIAENLRWGNQDAGMSELEQAAARAQAGFIMQTAEGFDSFLGSNGVNLSGGQKQRIAIARALLKDAAILILDDATSALDAITDARVRESLANGEKPPTRIIITQRCGTAMGADHILVMDNGRAAGFGSHAALMRSCEIYRDIYHTQIESSREE